MMVQRPDEKHISGHNKQMNKHKILKTILIMLFAFVVSVLFFFVRENRTEDTVTVEATGPTLPVAYMMVSDTKVNEMFGVRQTLNENDLRDSITPITQSKELTFVLDTNGMNVTGISYQITTPADEAVVENGQIKNFDSTDEQITAPFQIKEDLRTGQEYTLRFTVELSGATNVYFYTRVVQNPGVDMGKYFQFASDFVDMCLDKQKSDLLASYLETDSTISTGSYTDVSIASTQDDVSWGDLAPSLVKKATPMIVQVNGTTAYISLSYLISAQDSNDQTEYYRVKDYFRMRYQSDGSVALLDFHRSAHYIFDGSHQILSSDGLNLGVQSRDVNFRASDDQMTAAFELNGDLWTFNSESGKITRIFTFRQDDEEGDNAAEQDDRTQLTDHGIAIGKVTNAGDVTFVVYGYMPAGSHEGYMGVSVCQYTAADNAVQESVFIPLSQSPSTLMKCVSQLSYVSDDGYLYMFFGTAVYRVSLSTGDYSVVRDIIPDGGFAASNSQQTIAWTNADESGNATGITIMDLTSGQQYQVSKPEGEEMVLCGFINEDLVYGLVRPEDVGTDGDGNTINGMYQLTIQAEDGTIRKQYTPSDGVVLSVTQEDDGLELQLGQMTGNVYTETTKDHILNNELAADAVTLAVQTYDRTKMVVYMAFPATASTLPELQEVVADIRYTGSGTETLVQWPSAPSDSAGYDVYTDEAQPERVTSAAKAIKLADEGQGFVLTADQRVFWVRGDWDGSHTIDASQVPSGVLTCGFDADALQQAVGDSYTVFDLTGVTQDDWFYLIDRGYPVIAVGDNNEALLILGYDENNVWVYDASKGDTYAIASDDSRAEFENNGNRALTYIEM